MAKAAEAAARAPAVSRFAPAKVNLYLHVHGRRADGYHLLDSLAVFAGIGDRVEVWPADTLSIETDGEHAAELPGGEDNLVLRAARRLGAAAGCRAGARIRLVKALPVAAGIGGGSADAAAALRALAELWRLPGDAAIPPQLAIELGADVPVCLAGRPTQMSGIGETLRPAPPLPPFHLVLANPGKPLSTAEVFGRFAAGDGAAAPAGRPGALDRAPADAAALAALLAERDNDLEAPARSLLPEVGEVLARLARAPGCLLARMSGSGATCFGLFASQSAAARAADALAAASPAWWVRAAGALEADA